MPRTTLEWKCFEMAPTVHTMTRFLDIRQAYFPCLSAAGDRLAFLTNITGTPQAWEVCLPGEGE